MKIQGKMMCTAQHKSSKSDRWYIELLDLEQGGIVSLSSDTPLPSNVLLIPLVIDAVVKAGQYNGRLYLQLVEFSAGRSDATESNE